MHTGGIMGLLRYVLFDYGYVLRSRLRTVRYGLRAPDYRDGPLAPVLILPGVFETWHYLKAIIEQLHARGHPVHVVQSLGFNRRAVDEAAALVHDYLRDLDLRGVIIVAHSKGGLIGKRLMAFEDREEGRVQRMIAVNTPFEGSSVARYAIGRTMREFLPDNETLRVLNREVETNSRITSISSSFDQYIPSGSSLAGAENITLPLVGHFRLLEHASVIDAVTERIVSWSERPR